MSPTVFHPFWTSLQSRCYDLLCLIICWDSHRFTSPIIDDRLCLRARTECQNRSKRNWYRWSANNRWRCRLRTSNNKALKKKQLLKTTFVGIAERWRAKRCHEAETILSDSIAAPIELAELKWRETSKKMTRSIASQIGTLFTSKVARDAWFLAMKENGEDDNTNEISYEKGSFSDDLTRGFETLKSTEAKQNHLRNAFSLLLNRLEIRS